MQNKEQTIQKILQERYYENQQVLLLHNQSQCWSDILLKRDWSKLKQLFLSDCGITDSTFAIFYELNWPQLTFLSLNSNQLSSSGIKLIQNHSLTSLRSLNICDNSFGNNGVKFLIKMDLPNLEDIGLESCQLGSEGIRHLNKASWPNLKQIYLGSFPNNNQNKFQLSGWEFISHNKFKQLIFLQVQQTQPICMISCVLFPNKGIKIRQTKMQIKNEEMYKIIMRIMRDRNVLKEQDDN